MSEAKHTPGEWVAVANRRQRWFVFASEKTDDRCEGACVMWPIAKILNGRPGDTLETEAANARLFAASKDLLAACLAAKGLISAGVLGRLLGKEPVHGAAEAEINRVADLLNAALAKAEGDAQ